MQGINISITVPLRTLYVFHARALIDNYIRQHQNAQYYYI